MALAAHLVGYETLHGRKVSLLRVIPEYTSFLHQCYQNHGFMDLYRLAQNRYQSETQLRAQLLENSQYTPEQLRKFEWVVHKRQANGKIGQPIGLAAVADYMKSHQRAEFLIGIVDPNERKAGVSLEVTLLVLDFAFNHLKLNKLLMLVYEHNLVAHQTALHFGFKPEGFFPQHLYYPDKGFIGLYQDAFLAQDFFAHPRLRRWSLKLLGRDISQKFASASHVFSDAELLQLTEQLNSIKN